MNVRTEGRTTQAVLSARGASFATLEQVQDFPEINALIDRAAFTQLDDVSAFFEARQFAQVGEELWINRIPLSSTYDPVTCLWERLI